MPTAFGYTRASTCRQVVSTTAQREQIDLYVTSRLGPAGVVWAQFFEDEATSGRTRLRERPAGRKLDKALAEGDHVVITKTDRGFRSVADLHMTLEDWQARGITTHVLQIGLDTSTAVGELLIGILGNVARFESRLRSERVSEACQALKRAGKVWCNTPPYGFRIVGKIRGRKTLAPDPAQRAMGRAFLEQHQAGRTLREIVLDAWARKWEDVRFAKGHPARQWTPKKVKKAIEAERCLQEQANGAANERSTER